MRDKRKGQLTNLTAATLVFAVVAGVSLPAMADCSATQGQPDEGDKVYHATCVACHSEDGRGAIPGVPDFTKKGGVLGKPHAVMSKHIKEGFAPPGAMIAMPPKGGNPDLTDKDIDDVHAYLHQKFGCG